MISATQSDYETFLESKQQLQSNHGFEPVWMPDWLFDFQKHLVEWACLKGRGAIFAGCGLGKTPTQLAWAENVARKTGKPALILTPLAVSHQTIREAEKFGVEAYRSATGKVMPNITVTNYERLKHFDPADFGGVVCDEASIIKHWSGATQKAVTRFMNKMPYRLLCTATPAPNDYIEMGTHSEALGEMTYSEMLGMFFRQISDDEKKRKATADDIIHSRRLSWRVIQSIGEYAMKPHAFEPFWKWVSSFAMACRKPSDIGPYDDARFALPELIRRDHIVTPRKAPPGFLFTIPAFGLNQERGERRRTVEERSELVCALTRDSDCAVVWCQLNDEADRIEEAVSGAVQIKGSLSLEEKEERLIAFLDGQARVLVTKPKIAGLGLNLQHCAHVVTFVDHSYEQFYQAVRRCWRFGQKRPVTLDVIATEGEINVQKNMDRKERLAEQMFEAITQFMNDSQKVSVQYENNETEIPAWLAAPK
jgi:superfamily II DNA or RNA helicase